MNPLLDSAAPLQVQIGCVYRKLKPERSDGEGRRGWVVNESFRSDESGEKSAHPYAKTDVF